MLHQFENEELLNAIEVDGVSLHALQHLPDLRGSLCVAQKGDHIPFNPQRVFFVFGVPDGQVRGEHAHKECHQFLICLRGSVKVIVDDGEKRGGVPLDQPDQGLYLKPGVWGVQYDYSPDAMLAVIASDVYDEDDYLRNYEEFLLWVKENKQIERKSITR